MKLRTLEAAKAIWAQEIWGRRPDQLTPTQLASWRGLPAEPDAPRACAGEATCVLIHGGKARYIALATAALEAAGAEA